MAKTETFRWAVESHLSLLHLPCDNEADRAALEGAVNHHLKKLDDNHWQRCIDYFRNTSFLNGNPYCLYRWNGTDLSVNSPGLSGRPEDRFIPKTSDNRLKRPVEVNTSLLTIDRPYPEISPAGPEPSQLNNAKISEILIQMLWENPLQMPQRLREMALILCTQGTAGVELEYGETGVPETFPETKTVTERDSITDEEVTIEVPTGKQGVRYKKDFTARVYGAFNIQADPGATHSNDSLSWLCRTTIEDLYALKMRYEDLKDEEGYWAEAIEGISATSTSRHPLIYWERLRGMLDQPADRWSSFGNIQDTPLSASTTVLLRVVDVKPSSSYPEGRTIIMAGEKLIYCGPARAWSEKYPWRWSPMTIFRFWQSPGRFYGEPLLAPLVPLQQRINAIDAQLATARAYMGPGQWMIPRQVMIQDQKFSGNPGEHFVYNGGGGLMPTKITHQSLPSDVFVERDLAVRAIESLAGINEVMAGESSSQHRSAGVIQSLSDKVHESKSGMLLAFQDSLQRMMQNILIEASTNFDDEIMERLRRAANEFGEIALAEFQQADLTDNLGVSIDLQSELVNTPSVKATRAAEFLASAGTLVQLGQMSPETPRAIAEAMGLSDLFLPTESLQTTRARTMIEYIRAGKFEHITPYPEDDPQVFVNEFTSEILRERFKSMPGDRKETLLKTKDRYADVLKERMATAMKAQMAAQMGENPQENAPPDGSQA